jgi:cobalt-zinc-cadmium efflux system outer membrane protein
MTKQSTATLMALCFLFVASTGRAQPPGDVRPLAEHYIDLEHGLSVEQAVARALAGEPSTRVWRADLEGARGLRVQAALRPNPTLSFERREEPGGTDNQTTVSLEWPLDLFRRSARIGVRDREVDATEHSVADRLRTLAADVRLRYGRAAAAVRDVAVADDVTTSMRRQFDVVKRRVDEGASPPLERNLLDVELRRVESDRLLAAGRADAAMFELKRVLGMSADSPLTLRDTLEALVSADSGSDAEPAAPTAPSLQDPAVMRRADVREAGARVRLADARIDQARSDGRLDVSLFGAYMRMDAGFAQRAFTGQGTLERVRGQFHYLSAGAMVRVPLTNRNQGEIAAAQAERTAATARLDAAQLSAQSEIAAATAVDARARQALGLLESSVRLSRQNLEVMRQTYELGRSTVSEVLTERRRHLDVERAYTEALRAAYEARTARGRARGDL